MARHRIEAWIPSIIPRDRILSASSSDGIHFERDSGIRLEGQTFLRQTMVYFPFIHRLAVGYWRMYYHQSSKEKGWWNSQLLSAVSDDCLNWQREPGTRLGTGPEGERRHFRSPCIVPFRGENLLFYCAASDGVHFQPHRVESEDGLNFSASRSMALGKLGNVLDVHVVNMGEQYLRAYFTCDREIYSAVSADALSWDLERGTRMTANDVQAGGRVDNPSVVQLADGTCRLYFRALEKGPIGGRIYSAVSEDGLDFAVESGVRLDCSGPFERHGVGFPHVFPMGRAWKMYYVGYWGRHLLAPWTLRHWRDRE